MSRPLSYFKKNSLANVPTLTQCDTMYKLGELSALTILQKKPVKPNETIGSTLLVCAIEVCPKSKGTHFQLCCDFLLKTEH